MSDKAKVHARLNAGNQHEFYDQVTQELVSVLSPLMFDDDFIGAGHNAGVPAAGTPTAGYPWVKKIVGVGPPTVALVSNAAGGQMACALAATSEKEDAALYWNDNLSLDATKGLIWSSRVALSVLPQALVQMVWGVQSAWIDGPDNASFYVGFGVLANGTVLMRSKDGVTTNAIATGVTVNAGDFHNYRIDLTEVTDVKFFIDGAIQNTPGQIKFAATGANAILQTYLSAYKASGTSLGTLVADAVMAFNFR